MCNSEKLIIVPKTTNNTLTEVITLPHPKTNQFIRYLLVKPIEEAKYNEKEFSNIGLYQLTAVDSEQKQTQDNIELNSIIITPDRDDELEKIKQESQIDKNNNGSIISNASLYISSKFRIFYILLPSLLSLKNQFHTIDSIIENANKLCQQNDSKNDSTDLNFNKIPEKMYSQSLKSICKFQNIALDADGEENEMFFKLDFERLLDYLLTTCKNISKSLPSVIEYKNVTSKLSIIKKGNEDKEEIEKKNEVWNLARLKTAITLISSNLPKEIETSLYSRVSWKLLDDYLLYAEKEKAKLNAANDVMNETMMVNTTSNKRTMSSSSSKKSTVKRGKKINTEGISRLDSFFKARGS